MWKKKKAQCRLGLGQVDIYGLELLLVTVKGSQHRFPHPRNTWPPLHTAPLLNPADAQPLIALINAGQYEKAEAAARRWTKKSPDDHETHFFLGVALIQLRKLSPAAHSFRRALALKPDHFGSVNNLAAVLEEEGKHEEAIALCQRAAVLQPAEAPPLRLLGILYQKLDRSEEALAAFFQAMERDPRHMGTLNSTVSLLARLGRKHEALALIHRTYATDQSKDPVVIQANIAVAEHDLGFDTRATLERIMSLPHAGRESVSIKMWAALQLDRPEEAFALRTDKLNILSYAALPPAVDDAYRATLPKLAGDVPSPDGPPVIFTGASGDYAEVFFKNLVASAFAKSPDVHVHLHLMNPGSYSPEAALSAFPRARLTWTTESISTPEKTIFSTRRFVRLAQIMAGSSRTFFALDADSLINGDISGAVEGLRPFDVLTYDRLNHPFANQMVNASFLAFAGTDNARTFLDFLVAYILHFEAKGEAKWFIDQLALLAAKTWFAKNRPDILIKPAPRHMLDWSKTSSPDSIIWTAKGRSKDKALG